jgi:hypothetical protein
VLALAAGCGGGGQPERAAGPVAVLYVLDHLGADPPQDALAPYARAFARVRAGCRISAQALANRILHLAEQATQGSGVSITNLQVLRELARTVGTTKRDCSDLFVLAEARLEGGALG